MYKLLSGINAWMLALAAGCLMALGWPMHQLTLLVFIAWIPLLIASEKTASPVRFFFMAWLSMLVWNLLTTWWVWNASPAGAAGAILVNSMLMALPWMAYRFCTKYCGKTPGSISLIVFWLTWEYFHFNWELSWPWLTLGNALATHPGWVYWYSVTGVAGGSAWIVSINLAAWRALRNSGYHGEPFFRLKTVLHFVPPAMLKITPLLLSLFMRPANNEGISAEVVVLQPNVEAYTEKFNTPPDVLLSRMIALTDTALTPATQLVVWPETALPLQAWEDELSDQTEIQRLKNWINAKGNLAIVTGVDSYKRYAIALAPSGFSARKLNDGTVYEAFNSAMFYTREMQDSLQLYHKSKLVPGVETLPSWLGFMSSLFDSFGGISGSLGRSDSAVVFRANEMPLRPAPIICYESVYGDYVADYVRRGANLITIITNDGWWGDTPGYKQHMQYGVLRALETHRWVARSANTGISCFITPDGSVLQPQPWNTAAAIRQTVYVSDRQTFYVRFGDWLSMLSAALAIYFFGLSLYRRSRSKPHLEDLPYRSIL